MSILILFLPRRSAAYRALCRIAFPPRGCTLSISEKPFSHPQYRADIDGLRALAVLPVVIFHAFPTALPGGFAGVDIFFVISGYLISTIIFTNIEKDTFSFLSFYVRRIKRIFPALIAVLVFTIIAGHNLLISDEYKQLGYHTFGGSVFLSNFILSAESGYFDNTAETKPLLHLWSLGIEEQFYIIWPFVIWVAYKTRFRPIFAIFVILLSSFLLNVFSVSIRPVHTFFAPQTRFWELLCGGALAWLTLHSDRMNFDKILNLRVFSSMNRISRTIISPNMVSFAGFFLILFSFYILGRGVKFPGAWAAMPVLGAVLIISAGEKAWINRHILANRFAVGIGLISYPLYLWHWPLLSFARIQNGALADAGVRVALVIASIALAVLTFFIIERPIRRAPRPTALAAALAGLLAIVGGYGFFVHKQDGLPTRAVAKLNGNEHAFDWPGEYIQTANCSIFVGKRKLPYCIQSPDYRPSVALLGDSHANAIYPLFERIYADRRQGVIMLGSGGCPPFLGVKRDLLACEKVTAIAVDHVLKDANITDVYLSGRFAAAQTGIDPSAHDSKGFFRIGLVDKPAVKDRSEIFRVGLELILKKLVDGGKRVTIILDSAEFAFDPRSCLTSRGRTPCGMDKSLVLERQKGYREIIAGLAAAYPFKILDLLDAVCDDKTCYGASGGKILYRDPHHLGLYGIDHIATRSWNFP